MAFIKLIKDTYHDIIQEIMAEYGVEPMDNPSHIIPANADFAQVLQHTDWYVYRGDTRPPYRYRRYWETLNYLRESDKYVTHIDIGCGAGLFSWVLLDQAKIRGIHNDRVSLYGLDHCYAMVHLAGMIRERMLPNIVDYPALNYFTDVDALLNKLAENHRVNTDYIITFGHVLVQANAIHNFARIIVYIAELMDNQSSCMLIGSDARGSSGIFSSIWDSLLRDLALNGILYAPHNIVATSINDGNCAKRTQIYLNR